MCEKTDEGVAESTIFILVLSNFLSVKSFLKIWANNLYIYFVMIIVFVFSLYDDEISLPIPSHFRKFQTFAIIFNN